VKEEKKLTPPPPSRLVFSKESENKTIPSSPFES
jgi:hypothetical protein